MPFGGCPMVITIISEGLLVKDWGGKGGNELFIIDTLPDWS
jgi:hypothetical protein